MMYLTQKGLRGIAVLGLSILAVSGTAHAITLVTSFDQGSLPTVSTYSATHSAPPIPSSTFSYDSSFFAYDTAFQGGVRVAVGDVNGDGFGDIITGPGEGGTSQIKVFSGKTQESIRDFLAYGAAFSGGVFVASGDINGDGYADIVTGAGPGAAPHVKVFSGRDQSTLHSFLAYNAAFSGGVRVAAGDINGDGLADIITGPGPGGAAVVNAFDGASGEPISNFFAFDPTYTGGVFVAAADFNFDGKADIVAGGDETHGPDVTVISREVRIFINVTSEIPSLWCWFDILTGDYSGGARVAVLDFDGDGYPNIAVAPGPGTPQMLFFYDPYDLRGPSQVGAVSVPDVTYSGGVFVGAISYPAPLPHLWMIR